MDTRTKIVSLDQARAKLNEGNWLIVAGYFDPLTVSVPRRLHNLVDPDRKEKVLMAVLDDPQALLSSKERSVLVAALRVVDAVVIVTKDNLADLTRESDRIRYVFDLDADGRNSSDFLALVLRKQQAAVRPNGVVA